MSHSPGIGQVNGYKIVAVVATIEVGRFKRVQNMKADRGLVCECVWTIVKSI